MKIKRYAEIKKANKILLQKYKLLQNNLDFVRIL